MPSPTQKKKQEQGKLREMPLSENHIDTKAEIPVTEKEQKSPVTVSIIGDKIKFIMRDPQDYIVSMSIMNIKDISRVDYNVVMGELILILPETSGTIDEQQVPVRNKHGVVTSHRNMIRGIIGSYKTKIEDNAVCRQFMVAWLEITDEELDEVFEGFKAHDVAQEKLNDAIQQKLKEKDQQKPSGLIDEYGKALK